MRPQFAPTLWTKKAGNPLDQVLSQVWFPGVHCSIGGGDRDNDLSSITLAWMVGKLHKHTMLECDLDYLESVAKKTTDVPWATGPWEESCVGWFRLGGKKLRTPGQGKDTFEAVHISVDERKKHEGSKYITPDLNHLKKDKFGHVELRLREARLNGIKSAIK